MSQHLFSTYCVPGIVLNALHVIHSLTSNNSLAFQGQERASRGFSEERSHESVSGVPREKNGG